MNQKILDQIKELNYSIKKHLYSGEKFPLDFRTSFPFTIDVEKYDIHFIMHIGKRCENISILEKISTVELELEIERRKLNFDNKTKTRVMIYE